MKGIFQRHSEEDAGEIDCAFKRRIEEYCDATEGYCELVVMEGSSRSGVLDSCSVGCDVEQVGRVAGMAELLLVLGDSSDCFAGGSSLLDK